MKPDNFSRSSATVEIHRQWSAIKLELQKRPAGHTAGLFLSLNREIFANSSPEVKHRHNLYPAVIPQNGITSPKL